MNLRNLTLTVVLTLASLVSVPSVHAQPSIGGYTLPSKPEDVLPSKPSDLDPFYNNNMYGNHIETPVPFPPVRPPFQGNRDDGSALQHVPDPARLHNLTGGQVSFWASSEYVHAAWHTLQAAHRLEFTTGSNSGNYKPVTVSFNNGSQQIHRTCGSGDWAFVLRRNVLLLVDLGKAQAILQEERAQASARPAMAGGPLTAPAGSPAFELRHRVDPRNGVVFEGRFLNGQFAGERPIAQAQLVRDPAGRPIWVAQPAFNLPPVPAM